MLSSRQPAGALGAAAHASAAVLSATCISQAPIRKSGTLSSPVIAPPASSCPLTTSHTASVQAFLAQHHKNARGVGGAFDFISFCPPYEKVSYPELLLKLDESALVKDSTIVLVEYAKGQASEILPCIGKRLRRVRDRRYGRTFIALYACAGRDEDTDDLDEEMEKWAEEVQETAKEIMEFFDKALLKGISGKPESRKCLNKSQE